MPTIEIISVGALRETIVLPAFRTFEYTLDSPPRTHRWLFKDFFAQVEGVVLHLGNQGLAPSDDFWFAGELMQWRKVGASAAV